MGLSRAFQSHGEFCASHPWEVIVGTIALLTSVVSISAISSVDKVCGWNINCHHMQDVQSSDVLILTITRCIAVIYIYLQFRNLRKLGSKYLLGITGIFTIFSSFVFSIAVVNLAGGDLTGLNEALPFFLLLVDLTKACGLAKFVLSSKDQNELVDNIGQGMSILGPAITLDTLVETLVIGIGMLSGVRTLETMCCFGCLTVVANFLAFMTFYPACLALTFELLKGNKSYGPVKQLQQITMLLEESHKKEDENPVRQRVKLIMSAGLMVFHTMSRMVVDGEGEMESDLSTEVASGRVGKGTPLYHEMTFWQYFLHKTFSSEIEYTFPVLLSLILTLKYIFFDEATDKKTSVDSSSLVKQDEEHKKLECRILEELNQESPANKTCIQSSRELLQSHDKIAEGNICPGKTDTSSSSNENSPVVSPRKKSVAFCIGTDSDNDEEEQLLVQLSAKQEVQSTASQTDRITEDTQPDLTIERTEPRPLSECVAIMKSDNGPSELTNMEIMQLVHSKHIPAYKLESMLGDHERGVLVRRTLIDETLNTPGALHSLPYKNYEYKYVEGACCENVIGYMPVPVGVAGPLLLDDHQYHVPMATTEGCLVASTNRGCRALSLSGGARSCVLGDGMTRAPVVRFSNAARASQCKSWLEDPPNFTAIKEAFDSTSRFGKLQRLHIVQAARNLYIRFVAKTGDAMGMNMVSKGSERALKVLQESFSDIEILSLSGNFCTDKKPSAINWLEGRGKSVVCDAVIPSNVVKTTLKTSVQALVDLNISKNLMGSAMAGSIGGFNAHAANIVTAIFIATGQDPAQNVSSSNCLTVMEATGSDGEDLYISCTMPSIEVGTLGGGTNLPPQAACLQMLGIKGSKTESPGENASKLAQIICGAVMAGELSLMSALAAGHLVRSHLKHNRSSLNMSDNSASSINSAVSDQSKTINCADKLS